MPKATISELRVQSLFLRRSPRNIRDARLGGFGVPV